MVDQPKDAEFRYRVIPINLVPENPLSWFRNRGKYENGSRILNDKKKFSTDGEAWIMMKKKRKKYFLEGLAYKRTKINPDDVIYRKGVERPSDKEVIKEVKKQEFKHNRVAIYMSGTIIVAAASKVIFGVELSYPVLLGFGAVVGTLLFFLDRWIDECIRKEPEKPRDEHKQ